MAAVIRLADEKGAFMIIGIELQFSHDGKSPCALIIRSRAPMAPRAGQGCGEFVLVVNSIRVTVGSSRLRLFPPAMHM